MTVPLADRSTMRATLVLLIVLENDLWGATPFSTFVHLGLHNQAAWNATAVAATSALLADGAGDSPAEFDALLARAAGPALDSMHKVVCIAYYLPDKYQAVSPASTDLDRRPPRPRKDSRVRLFRTARWEAYVAGFSGFATPPRFVYESAKLAHTLIWHQEKFKWGTAILFEYDPQTKSTERWNEVLIPAEHWRSLLLNAEELYAEETDSKGDAQVMAQ
ncbi:heme-binding 2-like [Chlorella sorokiniana]|uniref:Heme-binding 2-like n=1 Tax=Chlorella sorokiniana TaxID=3076 RepID=A0A2P6TJW9_CHLSO|nr:heme-binding 2-like [Chlorella sorokiniana]|eukprot:PRW44380.1 heme-binding 2-like [Chlorella sorokiniana]